MKNGILYWYSHERARKAAGQIVVKNIEAMEIKDKNRKQISLLYEEKLYTLESPVSEHEAQKWYNSIKLIQDMGDLKNLDPNRYVKLNVYTKENGRIVFKDYDLLLETYENKICNKIILYKWDKIFYLNGTSLKTPRVKTQ